MSSRSRFRTKRGWCCPFKRGKSDALLDNLVGKSYCGACWQKWMQQNLKKRYSNGRNPSNSRHEDKRGTEVSLMIGESQKPPCGSEDEPAAELDFLYNKDGVSYFVNRGRKLVYVMDHVKHHEPLLVGVLNDQGGTDLDSEPTEFPFEVQDTADHCETPLEAYEDIEPILARLARSLNKSKADLQIYDPYYCSGSVVRRMSSLGFKSVYNKCEDFYRVVQEGRLPTYDAIVVNPPYSTSPKDHIELLLKFLVSQDKPWFVLQPNYVYTKSYWEPLTSQVSPRPFFLTPRTSRAYVYDTPRGLRDVNAKKRKTAPFVTMWYCFAGRYTEQLYRWWALKGAGLCPRLTLACTEYFLPNNFKDSSDRTRRKKRKRKTSDVKNFPERKRSKAT